MRNFYYYFTLLLIAFLASCADQKTPLQSAKKKLSKQQRIEGAIQDRIFTTSDVDLGVIPYEKLFKAIDEGQKRAARRSLSRSMPGSIANPVWRERGPSNVGGRTRAIMIDESDPNRNRIWIGGVSGGLWRTEDVTQADPNYVKLGIYFESLSISDIAQDPNNFDVIYVSTGESYTGDVQGTGIFKSTDDGATWTLLPSTNTAILRTVNEIHVHINGDVYAASANGGLFRSQDGGGSWEKVLGTSLSGATSNNFHDFFYHEANQTFYTCNDNSIYKSTTGDRGDWTNIGLGKPGFPNDVNRIEFGVCETNPNLLFAIGAVGQFSSPTYVTYNGGENWSAGSEPAIFFGYGQAWYDLDIAADPYNCFKFLSGGVGMAESTSQGLTWRSVLNEVHVDHHNITFDPKKQNRIFFGNDGGFWMSENGGASGISKNIGYVTTQFYAGAIHPDAGSPYVMGGTQDNNSMVIDDAGLSPARSVWGGDGIFCFIDQNEPNIQIVSSQGGNYGLSINGGQDFGFGATIDGAFINRSGYDDEANILYGQSNASDFFRWNVNTSQVDEVDISGRAISVSAVKADPNNPNRVYLGGGSGVVLKVDNAHTGGTVTASVFADLPGNASVSCIYLDKQDEDHALVSLFNFGASLENIYVTYNGGGEWTGIEGDLPDLPVRWALFDPADHDRAMIATDAGVWTTDDINGDQTHWEPTNPDNGMPFVRVDMLLMRESDKVVLAATYGRGLMTTDVFSVPAPVIITQPIAYEGQPVVIDGSFSVNAQDYKWNLGDNTTSQEPTITHAYEFPGVYTISLTINGSIKDSMTIAILPYLPSPYQVGTTDYAGDFESHPEHFAAYNVQGTGFQKGASTKPGKDGTNSGAAAWVLGINDNFYQNNTRAEVYTPMYDLSEPGLYELKFFGKFAVENRSDGFQIEYSLDGGATWHQLGTRNDPNWYNYLNSNLADGAFPEGKSYFTNAQLNWTQYIKDISFLAGEATVSFRYVFRSDASDEIPGQGLAIDDFEVTKYEGELKTIVTVFEGSYTGEQDVTINWVTSIEYKCKRFQLERSYNGFGWEKLSGEVPAKGYVSTFPNSYSKVDQNLRDVVYYRLNVVHEDTLQNFYTDPIVLRREVEPDIVNVVLPNPFKDYIGVSFSSEVNQQIHVRLFDISGKLIREDITVPNGIFYQMEDVRVPQGVYVLSIQIGDGELESFKLLSINNEY